VIVEALAHGLPVVATANAGPLEILKHGEYGRIVPIGDELQLARAIADTLDDPGDPAVRRSRAEDFSFRVRVPTYEALIADVLAERTAPASLPSLPGNGQSQLEHE
jgi:glycosyltransferase involved in cell wall biosynthesis